MKQDLNLVELFRKLIYEKEMQGFNVRIKEPDYLSLVIIELNQLENLSLNYKEELLLISKYIRKNAFRYNDDKLIYQVIFRLNYIYFLFANTLGINNYWNIDTVTSYAKHMFLNLSFCRESSKTKLIDDIHMTNMKKIIIPQWNNILEASNGEKAFIDIFDDFFMNAIEKYPQTFIKKLKDSDVLCRMVPVKDCDENRFIPLPKCTRQNRWNPPGKSFLYMSYGESENFYNKDICLEEKVCLLECRTKSGTNVSFCRFSPKKEGRILDLSYNNVELYDLKKELDIFANDNKHRIIKELLTDRNIIKKNFKNKKTFGYIKDKIKKEIDAIPNTKEKVTEIIAKLYLKSICSCIYSKVDGTEKEKEKEYKSFHILSNYLEAKGITGIIYPCTRDLKLKGKNIVLFNLTDAEPIKGTIKKYYYYK